MTNEAALLTSLVTGQTINPQFQPQNNKQAYLAYLNGLDISLPTPQSIEEYLLYSLCANGVGGGGADLPGGSVDSGIKFTGIDGKYLFAYGARMDKMDKLLSMCSELTDLYGMFYGATPKFKFDMSKIDTSKVTSVEMMFGASKVTSVDMSKNDMSACTDFSSMFHNCSDLESIFGFSAPRDNVSGSIGFPKGSSSSKYKLKRLTFRTDITYAIQHAIDIRNNSFNREGMVEMFDTLPNINSLGLADYRKSIYISGNPCVDGGTTTFAAGNGVFVNSYEEVCEIFYGLPLDTEIVLNVNYEGQVSYARLEDALVNLERREYPLFFSWNQLTYVPELLTDEDKAIATDKGWTIVEG